MASRARRPDPPAYELDDTCVVAVGTALWVAALVVLLVADVLGVDVPGWWVAMCGCGLLLGLVGLRQVARRRARIRA